MKKELKDKHSLISILLILQVWMLLRLASSVVSASRMRLSC